MKFNNKIDQSLFNTEFEKLSFENLCEAIIDIMQHKDDKDYDIVNSIYENIYKPFLKDMLEHQNDLIYTILDLMKYNGTKELKEQKKNNSLYEYHVYYIHDNESYVFKTSALNENDAKNKTMKALNAFEDLKIYDIVKV